ncbi:putative C-type lectin [Trypoxylus dichotomus]
MILAGSEVDIWEVARQNRITQQILQSFLEKKLFPTLKRPLYTRPPSVWEILPKTQNAAPPPKKNIQELLNNTEAQPGETLQVVESEQISSVYDNDDDDDLEGMFCFIFTLFYLLKLVHELLSMVYEHYFGIMMVEDFEGPFRKGFIKMT